METPAIGLNGVTVSVGLALCLLGICVRRRFDDPGVGPFAAFAVLCGLAGVSAQFGPTGRALAEVRTLF